MKYILFFLPLSLFSSCFGDKHPEYPYLSDMVDHVDFFHVQTDTLNNLAYAPLVINGKSVYRKGSNFYGIQGNWIKTLCLDSLFSEQDLEITGKQTDTGYCILYKRHKGSLDIGGFYLFDFESEKLIAEIPILDMETWLESGNIVSTFNPTLVRKLTMSDLRLPIIPKRLFAGDYNNYKDFQKAEKERAKKLQVDYQKVVMNFVAKHKDEVCVYEFYNEVLHRNTPCFVFVKQGWALKIEEGMKMDGLAIYANYLLPKVEKLNPPITFRQTGKASLGYRFRLIVSLIPWFEEDVVYYYEMVCDGKTFNFKSVTPNICLYDYDLTTDYIYFALMLPSHKVDLYRFKR